MHWAQRIGLLYLGALAVGIWGYGVGEHHWWPHKVIKEISEFIEGDPEEAKTSVLQKLQNDLGVHPHRKLVKYQAQEVHPKSTKKRQKWSRNTNSKNISSGPWAHGPWGP